jgi:hypothetical protein
VSDVDLEAPYFFAVAQYDSANVLADPAGIDRIAVVCRAHGQVVADSIERINRTLHSLMLNGWKGKTQQEAQDFTDRWNKVMVDLFGSKENPKSGVFNAVVDGIHEAAGNHAKSEVGAEMIIKQFIKNIGGSGGGPSQAKPLDKLDTHTTAITADY